MQLQGGDVDNAHGEAAAAVIPKKCLERSCERAVRYANYSAVDALAEGMTPQEAARRTIGMIGKICGTCTEVMDSKT